MLGESHYPHQMKNFNSLQSLLHNSDTFYLIAVNMDSTYSYVNPLYAAHFEPQHGELKGKHYALTMHHEDTVICQEVAGKCFADPSAIFPAVIRKHDGKGTYVVTQWDYKAMMDEDGIPMGIYCIGYDITTFISERATLEQLAHIQSHVIRRPIANLVGLIGLLETSQAEHQRDQLIEMIKSEVNDLELLMHLEKKNPLIS